MWLCFAWLVKRRWHPLGDLLMGFSTYDVARGHKKFPMGTGMALVQSSLLS